MPALPSSLLEPIFVRFAALCPEPPGFDPSHPLGCHRRRIPNRVVSELLIAALVHGSGYERVATEQCSDRTIRRRLHLWAEAGLGEQLHELALDTYDRMISLDLADVSAEGAITKAPCGGDRAGRSPVDRGKGRMKHSTGVDGYGVPLGIVGALANRHDSPLLRDTFEACSTQLRHCWNDAPIDPCADLRSLTPHEALNRLAGAKSLRQPERAALADAVRTGLSPRS